MKYQGFVDRFKSWKATLGLTNYGIEKRTGYSRANLTNLEKGLIGPSDELLEKLASIPEYDISIKELMAWRAMDEYGPETIEQALKVVEGAGGAKGCGLAGGSGEVELSTQERIAKDIEHLLNNEYQRPLFIPCSCGSGGRVTADRLSSNDKIQITCVECGNIIEVKNNARAVLHELRENLRKGLEILNDWIPRDQS